MGKRRTRADLLCEVLESIDSGIKKPTHILYNTKVSWTVLQQMLDLLQERKYIEKHQLSKNSTKSRVNYSLTDEGKDILANMQYLRNTLQINVGD
jgi:predicted transcriptional regulator